jgi:hypothetical protein
MATNNKEAAMCASVMHMHHYEIFFHREDWFPQLQLADINALEADIATKKIYRN